MDPYGSKTHVNFITINSSVDLLVNSDFKQHFEHFSQSTLISSRFPRRTSMHNWYEKKNRKNNCGKRLLHQLRLYSLMFRNCTVIMSSFRVITPVRHFSSNKHAFHAFSYPATDCHVTRIILISD